MYTYYRWLVIELWRVLKRKCHYRIRIPLQGVQPQLLIQWCCWYGRVSCWHATTVSRHCRKKWLERKCGGWLIIRMKLGECPVICLSQDEAILKQYIFTNKLWTYKSKCRIVPKDKGYWIMISASQSREFGFVYPLTVQYIQTINEYCALHPKYVDMDASTTILGHTHKEPTTMGRNPLCQYSGYGARDEVYWTYELMVLKLEEWINIITALHTGIYFIFLFYHSCGNDRGK